MNISSQGMSVRRIFFSEEVWFSFWQKKRYIWKCKFAAKKSLVLWLKQWWVVKQQTLLLGFSKSIPSRVSKTLNFGDSLTQPKIFMFIGFTKKWAHVIKKNTCTLQTSLNLVILVVNHHSMLYWFFSHFLFSFLKKEII